MPRHLSFLGFASPPFLSTQPHTLWYIYLHPHYVQSSPVCVDRSFTRTEFRGIATFRFALLGQHILFDL